MGFTLKLGGFMVKEVGRTKYGTSEPMGHSEPTHTYKTPKNAMNKEEMKAANEQIKAQGEAKKAAKEKTHEELFKGVKYEKIKEGKVPLPQQVKKTDETKYQ